MFASILPSSNLRSPNIASLALGFTSGQGVCGILPGEWEGPLVFGKNQGASSNAVRGRFLLEPTNQKQLIPLKLGAMVGLRIL